MAKSDFASKQELQDYINSLKEIDAQYKQLNKQAKELASTPGKAQQEVLKQLRVLKEQYDTHKEILISIKRAEKELADYEKTQQKIAKSSEKTAEATKKIAENTEQQSKRLKEISEDWEEIDGLQRSITSEYGKQYGDINAIQKKIDGTKALVDSISKSLQKDSNSYGEQLDSILEIVDAYKSFPVQFANLNKERKQGRISEKQMQKQISENLDQFDSMISKLDTSNEKVREMVELFKQMSDEQKQFNKISDKQAHLKSAAGAVISEFTSGAPGYAGMAVRGGEKIVQGFTEPKSPGGKMSPLATAALVAGIYAVGKAYTYYLDIQGLLSANEEVRTKQTANNNIILKQRLFETNEELYSMADASRRLQYQLEINKEAGDSFVSAFAKFDFNTKMMQLTQEFKKASATAFFGQGLGSLNYASNQLELAGINAGTLAEATKSLSTGANSGIAELGDIAAVAAQRFGMSVDSLAQMVKSFRRLDKLDTRSALNMTQMAQSLAFAEGINPGDFMQEMASASEIALDYNIANSKALMQQVKNAKLLGASWSTIAKAGEDMVLNYKDSIKAEMTLGAILGENIDLSQIRALFAANRPDEALALLKSTGLIEKAQAAGFFAVQATKQALGQDLYGAATAPAYEVGAGKKVTTSMQAANKGYLGTIQAASVNMDVAVANINLSRELEKKTGITAQGKKSTETGIFNEANLVRGLYFDPQMQLIYAQKMQNEIDKFFALELQAITSTVNPATALKAYNNTRYGQMLPGDNFAGTGIKPLSTYQSTPFYIPDSVKSQKQTIDNTPVIKNTQASADSLKNIDTTSKSTNTSIKSIDTNAKTQLSTIEKLTAMTAVMTAAFTSQNSPFLNGIKLFLDGKDITNSVIKRTVDTVGVNKSPALQTKK